MTDLTPEKVREWLASAHVDSSHRGPQMVALAEDWLRLHEEVEELWARVQLLESREFWRSVDANLDVLDARLKEITND